MALAPDTKLGPYEVQSLLGAGGMGEVYRARDIRLGVMLPSKSFRLRWRGTKTVYAASSRRPSP